MCQDGLKALVAGACSSLASVTITIPIEVVSQVGKCLFGLFFEEVNGTRWFNQSISL